MVRGTIAGFLGDQQFRKELPAQMGERCGEWRALPDFRLAGAELARLPIGHGKPLPSVVCAFKISLGKRAEQHPHLFFDLCRVRQGLADFLPQ